MHKGSTVHIGPVWHEEEERARGGWKRRKRIREQGRNRHAKKRLKEIERYKRAKKG